MIVRTNLNTNQWIVRNKFVQRTIYVPKDSSIVHKRNRTVPQKSARQSNKPIICAQKVLSIVQRKRNTDRASALSKCDRKTIFDRKDNSTLRNNPNSFQASDHSRFVLRTT